MFLYRLNLTFLTQFVCVFFCITRIFSSPSHWLLSLELIFVSHVFFPGSVRSRDFTNLFCFLTVTGFLFHNFVADFLCIARVILISFTLLSLELPIVLWAMFVRVISLTCFAVLVSWFFGGYQFMLISFTLLRLELIFVSNVFRCSGSREALTVTLLL